MRTAPPTQQFLQPKKGKRLAAGTHSDLRLLADGQRKLLCAHCEHPITAHADKIEKKGSHDHYFVNPTGRDFHVGCFSRADGCATGGPTTDEWTWFPGYTWQLGHCQECTRHIGWLYRSKTDSFHGLILDCLRESDGED